MCQEKFPMKRHHATILLVSFISMLTTILVSACVIVVLNSRHRVEVAPMPRTVLMDEDHPVQDMNWETLWKNSKHNKEIVVKLIMQFDGMDYGHDDMADVYIVDRKVKFKIGEIDFKNLPRVLSVKKGSGITFPAWSARTTYSHQDFVMDLTEQLTKFHEPPFPTSKILVLGRSDKEIVPLKIDTQTFIFSTLMD